MEVKYVTEFLFYLLINGHGIPQALCEYVPFNSVTRLSYICKPYILWTSLNAVSMDDTRLVLKYYFPTQMSTYNKIL